MTATTARPGLHEGVTNEFTLICRVRPGAAPALRAALAESQADPRRQASTERISTLHDSRWVVFDDDTRLMFCSNFDGDWDQYIDDFGAMVPEVFDHLFQYVEDYPGIRDPRIKDFLTAHQAEASLYFRAYPDASVPEVKKALRVYRSFEALLDEASS
jgi:hypothetical protein